jgi:hypothetical protein
MTNMNIVTRQRRTGRFRIGPVTLQYLTVALIAAASLFYLTQNGRVANKGYQINELNQKKAELQAENDRLKVEAARLMSLKSLKEDSKIKEMVPPSKIDYLPQAGNVAAK